MSIKQNPDTPRTNAELLEICEGNESYGYVRIDFARKLERENNKMRNALAHVVRWTNGGELFECERNAI